MAANNIYECFVRAQTKVTAKVTAQATSVHLTMAQDRFKYCWYTLNPYLLLMGTYNVYLHNVIQMCDCPRLLSELTQSCKSFFVLQAILSLCFFYFILVWPTCWTASCSTLKLNFRKYPAIHTHYS